MSSASRPPITGTDFATSSISSRHQLMPGLDQNPRAIMAFQSDPACSVAHAEIFTVRYPSFSSADAPDRPPVEAASRFGSEFTGFFRCPDVAASCPCRKPHLGQRTGQRRGSVSSGSGSERYATDGLEGGGRDQALKILNLTGTSRADAPSTNRYNDERDQAASRW